MSKILSLIKTDFKNITRDEVLFFMPLLPIIVGLVYRFGVPPLRNALIEYIDLADYYGFLTGIGIIMVPTIFGWIIGFLLLDERDENVLAVITTTPLGKRKFLRYRFALSIVISVILSIMLILISGLTPLRLLWTLPVIILASMEAPLVTLFLASFASNKIEGLAIGKSTGIFLLGSFVPLFVESKIHLLGGLSPTYWVTQSYIASFNDPLWYVIYLAGGVIVHIALFLLLMRKFEKRIG
jgi:hypothetical protein